MAFDKYRDVVVGLHQLQRTFDGYSQGVRLKLPAIHRAYFQQTKIEYTDEERYYCDHYLSALLHKHHMAGLALEQLWALSYDTRDGLWDAVVQSLSTLDVNDDDLALISFAFDTFLFHARAYLDFFMLYVCQILKTGQEGSISQKKFFNSLDRQSNQDLSSKTASVYEYFKNEVFSEPTVVMNGFSRNDWGKLLADLRDKVAHRDILRPSFESQEKLLNEITLNWPTIQETTLERFCQQMQNDMFRLITDMAEKLLDREWDSWTV